MTVDDWWEEVGQWAGLDAERCPACGFEMADHDSDPIGIGLVQYTCPEPSLDRYGNERSR